MKPVTITDLAKIMTKAKGQLEDFSMVEKPAYEELEKRVRELEKESGTRRRTEEALLKEKLLSDSISNNIPAGVAFLDNHFVLRKYNRAYAQLLRIYTPYTPEQALGMSYFDYVPGSRDQVEEWFLEVRDSGKVQTRYDFKLIIKKGDREQVTFWDTSIAPMLDPSGAVEGILILTRDVTDRKQAEEALRESQQQLYQAQKMDALGTLVAGVAHEINNPLSQVMFNMPLLQKLWLDLLPVLKEHSERNPDRKYGGLTYDFLAENLGQLLTDMEMAAKRVATIGSGLKSFARQSSVVDKRPIQINTAVTNAVRLAGTTIKKSGVHLELDLADDLPLMEGNLHCIEQIILNMTINGVEAVDHDRGELKIVSRFQEKDNRIRLLITDNGRGISPSISDKIFDPFVTDKQAEGGTGLGLSVSYSLVKAHDGKITFQSRKGEGTTFTLLFPAIVEPKAAKILLVDDDKSLCHVLRKAFVRERPYLVEETANGKEAIIKIATYHPDLLILDILMPEMDGLEVCRTIKNEPVLADMKVIIITGFPDHPKLKEVAELGFTDIFCKPFDMEDIMKAVDDMLS